jgi:hypothetical protein
MQLLHQMAGQTDIKKKKLKTHRVAPLTHTTTDLPARLHTPYIQTHYLYISHTAQRPWLTGCVQGLAADLTAGRNNYVISPYWMLSQQVARFKQPQDTLPPGRVTHVVTRSSVRKNGNRGTIDGLPATASNSARFPIDTRTPTTYYQVGRCCIGSRLDGDLP